jgi:hypothetical protein
MRPHMAGKKGKKRAGARSKLERTEAPGREN